MKINYSLAEANYGSAKMNYALAEMNYASMKILYWVFFVQNGAKMIK